MIYNTYFILDTLSIQNAYICKFYYFSSKKWTCDILWNNNYRGRKGKIDQHGL